MFRFSASAAVDSEGFPVFYIRGDQNRTLLGYSDEDYRFTRNGSNYTIHLTMLSTGLQK